MTDISNKDGQLPDDLRALDEELSSIRYEERPSFAPELRAELARAYAEEAPSRRSPLLRHLAAACLAALLVGGASVPAARASLVRLLTSFTSEPVERPAPAPEPADLVEAEEVAAVGSVEEVIVSLAPVEPVLEEAAPTVMTDVPVVLPEMLDRARAQRLLEEAYPRHLQRRGVGGTVWVKLWVDETGIAGLASVHQSSGHRDLDRAALTVAPRLTFAPALQGGRRLATWIRFPVLFEPDSSLVDRALSPVVDPLSLPTVPRNEWWQMSQPLDLAELPETPHVPTQGPAQAEASIAASLIDPTLLETHGPASAILAGEAPDGSVPTEWRAAVGLALEEAIDQGVETPASMLAYGRIRLRQGLRNEARSFFERGLRIALSDPDAAPWVTAELHFERGTLMRDGWLASSRVGRVRADAFLDAECTEARSTGAAGTGFASADRLVAWNYLCPGELTKVFAEGFEVSNSGSAGDLTLMMASFRAAVEAFPAHVGANTDLLVTLASEERWDDVLAGARRLTRASGGHVNGLLLAGVALHRLGRSEEAAEHFEVALERMDPEQADELCYVGYLLDVTEEASYRRLSVDGQRAFEDSYWATKDRSPSTPLNERWVEHMTRSSYALLRFGGVFGDAGEVWVRFGGPKAIHIVDEGSGRLSEFWDYGSGPDITFVRWVSANRTDLTPEGRAYVDDLGNIFPPQ